MSSHDYLRPFALTFGIIFKFQLTNRVALIRTEKNFL